MSAQREECRSASWVSSLNDNMSQSELTTSINLSDVYFDQRLGAAHPKRWSKSSFSAFYVLKSWKMQIYSCSSYWTATTNNVRFIVQNISNKMDLALRNLYILICPSRGSNLDLRITSRHAINWANLACSTNSVSNFFNFLLYEIYSQSTK